MNRYPLWKNLFIALTVLIAIVYTMPNFFGEVPAIQISPAKVTTKVDDPLLTRVNNALKAAGTNPQGRSQSVNVFDPYGYQVQLASIKGENPWI